MRNIWFDIETSGLDKEDDQILEAAIIVDDESGVEIERHEWLVKLKESTLPAPGALATNGINPFSYKHASNALSESDFVKSINDVVSKHIINGNKPRMVAYNGNFDKSFLSVAFARQGINIDDTFSKSLVDPMKLAENAIEAGLLKTKMNAYGGYSKKQEEVASALGVRYTGKGAHRALADVEVMRSLTIKLYASLSNSDDFHQSLPSPWNFNVGEVYRIVTNSKSSGIRDRHIMILSNDIENSRLIAIDEADIRDNGNKFSLDSSIRMFNYPSILKESENVERISSILKSVYNSGRKKDIDDKVHKLLTNDKKSEKKTLKDFIDSRIKNHSLVLKIRRRMNLSSNKAKDYDLTFKEIIKDLDGDKSLAKELMIEAEKYQESLGGRGWSGDILGTKNIKSMQFDPVDGESLRVILHPNGHYYFQFSYGNGFMVNEVVKAKRDLIKSLSGKSSNEAALISFINELDSPSAFKDPKHPSVLESEIKRALELAKADRNPNKLIAIHSLIERLKGLAPSTYSKYRNDNKDYFGEFYFDNTPKGEEEEFFEPKKRGGQLSFNIDESIDAKIDDKTQAPDDHAPDGSRSRIKCSVCSRALSKDLSKIMGMGPTCKARANFVDDSFDSPSEFTECMHKYTPNIGDKIKVGDALVVTYKSSGDELEAFVDSIRYSSTDDKITFVNRKKLKALLEAGEDLAVAEFKSTISIRESDVLSVGRLSPRKVDASKKNTTNTKK